MESLLEQLRACVQANDLRKALDTLFSVATLAGNEGGNNLRNRVLMIQAQLAQLRSDKDLSLLTSEQIRVGSARLVHATISLIDLVEASPEEFSAYLDSEKDLEAAARKQGVSLSGNLKAQLIDRMAYIRDKEKTVRALWIDDNPAWNQGEIQLLTLIGVEVDQVSSSAEAQEKLSTQSYQLLLSDIRREGRADEGIRFYIELVEKGIDLPGIFYGASIDRSKGVPPYAFGITYRPEELIHLAIDAIERM